MYNYSSDQQPSRVIAVTSKCGSDQQPSGVAVISNQVQQFIRGHANKHSPSNERWMTAVLTTIILRAQNLKLGSTTTMKTVEPTMYTHIARHTW